MNSPKAKSSPPGPVSLNTWQLNILMKVTFKYFLLRRYCWSTCFPGRWEGPLLLSHSAQYVPSPSPGQAAQWLSVCLWRQVFCSSLWKTRPARWHCSPQSLSSKLISLSLCRSKEVFIKGTQPLGKLWGRWDGSLPSSCPDEEFLQHPPCPPSPSM